MCKVIVTKLLSYDIVSSPSFLSARFSGKIESKPEYRMRKIINIFK
jgi:hypothetical protein